MKPKTIVRFGPLLVCLALAGCASGASDDSEADGAMSPNADAARTDATGGEGDGGGGECAPPTDRAFPTAEGFGAGTPGGRSGRIVRVTSLADDGPGSLRDACTQTGPRIIVFDVSGTIELQSNIVLREANSYVTIAAQTSPGGVQLRGIDRSLVFAGGFHDGIVRHLRVRPGGPTQMVNTANVIVIYGNNGVKVHNVIIDHCDIMWGGDEMASNYAYVSNTTWQWNIIAEGLDAPLGSSYGALADNNVADSMVAEVTFTFHHNLFSQNAGRNPFFKRSGTFDFRNNLVHNWSNNNSLQLGGASENRSAFGNFVNNVYLPGPTSANRSLFLANGASLGGRDRGGTRLWAEGNWGPVCPAGCADDWDNEYVTSDYYPPEIRLAPASEFRADAPFPAAEVHTDPAAEVEPLVLAGAGATRPSRDAATLRIIDDVRERRGFLRTDSGGPWPLLTGGPPPADADDDGMPDAWESAHGLDPMDPADGDAVGCNGWTHVENYLNELAGDPI